MMTSMNPRDLTLLGSAGLDGRTAIELDAGGKTPVLLVEVSTAEMVDVWRQARAALHSTRRWPVLVTAVTGQGPLDWVPAFELANPFWRAAWRETESDTTDYSPDTLLQRAAEVDLDERFEPRPHGTPSDERLEERINWACSDTRNLCGAAPSMEDVRNSIASDDPLGVERYLLKWEMAHGCSVDVSYQEWFEPIWPTGLALLPDARPWAAYAYVNTLSYTDHVVLIKAAQRWHERYGAEPVALWGTMTELLVSRQPKGAEEALRLALEHVLLADSTTGPSGVRLRWHARALMVLDHWHLASQP